MAAALRKEIARRDIARLHKVLTKGENTFWDVRFYPYIKDKEDPVIFAVVGSYAVYVFQITCRAEGGTVKEVDAWRREAALRGTKIHSLNSCTWCYLEEDEPLLAIAGENGQIQIIESWTGKLKFTLIGHGEGVVNDLATHPKYPWLIASASIDSSIRIWDLRRASDPSVSTCVIICGYSLAHKEGLLTIDWHQTGRFMLSGGFDHKVCVWQIPDLDPGSHFWYTISKEGRERSFHEVHNIYYPHFVASAIHTGYVDCVKFLGDMVLSKSQEGKIVLWELTGFNSLMDSPAPEDAPKVQEHLEVRNGFQRTTQKYGMQPHHDVFHDYEDRYVEKWPFRRWLQFENKFKSDERYYMRFGVAKPSSLFPDLHIILTVGDNESAIRHWDLERLSRGRIEQNSRKGSEPSRASSSTPSDLLSNAQEASNGATSITPGTALYDEDEQNKPDRATYPLHDPYRLLPPHSQNRTGDVRDMTTRGVAWSVCGKWCVVVGEEGKGPEDERKGLIAVYARSQ